MLVLTIRNITHLQKACVEVEINTVNKLPDRIIFEPSVLVYEKSVNVPLYEDDSNSVIRLSDEKLSSIKKPITTNLNDIHLLALLAQAEAGNQGPGGIARVIDVVLNRVESHKFPNNIKDVIFQPGQFQTAEKLLTMNSSKSSQHIQSIVYSELYGERIDKQSLYFGRFPITHKGLYQYGDHYFSY